MPLKIKLQTLKKGNDMDKNLKNALIIIAVLVGLYYFLSPYEKCVRDGYMPINCDKYFKW